MTVKDLQIELDAELKTIKTDLLYLLTAGKDENRYNVLSSMDGAMVVMSFMEDMEEVLRSYYRQNVIFMGWEYKAMKDKIKILERKGDSNDNGILD